MTPIETVHIPWLSKTAVQNLKDLGYETLEKIAAADDRFLLQIRGISKASLQRLKNAAERHEIPWTGHVMAMKKPQPALKTFAHDIGLRDYFAGHALMGIITRGIESNATTENIASWCYEYADALVAVRNKQANE